MTDLKLQVLSTSASTSITTGTSPTLEISIPSGYKTKILVGIATFETSFNIVDLVQLTTPSPYDFLACSYRYQSTGVELYYLDNPPMTFPGAKQTIQVELDGSYRHALGAIVFRYAKSGVVGNEGLDGKTTGDPIIPGGGINVNDDSFLVDVVRCESNTLVAGTGQTEVFNLVDGGDTLGMSYWGPLSAGLYEQDWVRQGTPTDDLWGLVGAEVRNVSSVPPTIINS